MVYELNDCSKVYYLFEGWKETLIYSCLQNVTNNEAAWQIEYKHMKSLIRFV
jgi:hypothetical protein